MSLRSGRAASLLALTLLAAACTSTPKPHPVPTSSGQPANLSKFYDQKPQWGTCGGYGDPSSDDQLPDSLQCTRISVPVDYSDPTGATAQIALSRSRATGQRIGSLLLNPGGPGVSGLSLPTNVGNNTPLSEHFDRIGFDPRGIGSSRPLIECYTAKEWDNERAEPPHDESPAGDAATENEEKQYASDCTKRTTDGNDFLAHVGTREVVQDMDIIRAVLGDAKLSYVGYSYGTRLGYAYAEQFPTHVRAMVLDGAVDPDQGPVNTAVQQAAGFQKVFNAYAADCVQQPDCPLGTDPAQAVAKFKALIAPLWTTPAPVSDGRKLSYSDAVTGVENTLYANDRWRLLTAGLKQLQQGQGDTLMELADLYDGRNQDGTYDNTQDAFTAIGCVDDPPIKDQATADREDAEFRKAAPFLDDGHAGAHAPLGQCAYWPVPNTMSPHKISAPGLPKTVVISTTDDPATPYQSGVNLANELGASLVTNHGDRHTVFLAANVSCVDDPVIKYLIDLTPPPAGLTCGA